MAADAAQAVAPPVWDGLDALLAGERTRLVRLCARITGDAEAAEDLAQETLIEAWRALAKLRDANGLSPWLAAIARNVCLRWMRQRSREMGRRIASLDRDAGENEAALRETLAAPDEDDGDPLRELERDELATLLERALALLPAETRSALVARYVEEHPAGEVAARLGVSEAALRVRLHRGRQALRGVLEGELLPEAQAYGVAAPMTDGWRDTRIACPFCGRHHVQMMEHGGADLADQRTREDGAYLAYRCSGFCTPGGIITGGANVLSGSSRSLVNPKAILTQTLLWLHGHYRAALREGAMRCETCGTMVPVRFGPGSDAMAELPAEAPLAEVFRRGVSLQCPRCDITDGATLWHLTLDMPEAQRFWQRHPRMRALVPREVEAAGVPALVTGFASMDGRDQLDVIVARDTLAVLGVHGVLGASG